MSCKARQEDARHIHFRLQTLKCFLSTTETCFDNKDVGASECCVNKVSMLVLSSWPRIKSPSSAVPSEGKAKLDTYLGDHFPSPWL